MDTGNGEATIRRQDEPRTFVVSDPIPIAEEREARMRVGATQFLLFFVSGCRRGGSKWGTATNS